ncbi:MAG TPA: NAD-dependent epimerase/dehydratase family protein [Gemmatimonadaceae bacterium]|nr:NAD-dependent epimerase/dehydratase family protein [Gemmatimonadaceae bacterium]
MSAARYQRALVTGGAGFIGSRVVRDLLARGIAVTILDDLSTGSRDNVPAGAELVVGDVRRADDVRRALAGVDAVFHLAAKVSVRGSFEQFYDDIETNVLGTVNLLRCLDPQAVRHFVLASSMAVYAESAPGATVPESHPQRPLSPYGVGKMSAELLCQQVLAQLGIPFTAFRYFNTFGPGQRFTPYVGVITIFVTKLLKGEAPTIFGDGQQRRDFVHVDDIAAGTVLALDGPGGTYNLGTGIGTTVNELAALLVQLVNPGVPVQHAPAAEGELKHSVADISAARRALGYTPRRTLRDDLPATIDAIRATVLASQG